MRVFILCFLPLFVISQEYSYDFDDDNKLLVERSVEGSGQEQVTKEIKPSGATSKPVAAFLFSEDEEPQKTIKQCSQTHYKICNRRIQKEHNVCVKKCKGQLSGFWARDSVMECFHPKEELYKWDECLTNGAEIYPQGRPSYVPVSEIQRFNYSLDDDYKMFTKEKGRVMLKKARNNFVHMRKFQHCYIHCMKSFEQTCHSIFNCAVSYPNPKDMLTIVEECPGYSRVVLEQARGACKCLTDQHDVFKLIGQCQMMGDRQFMRRI